MAFFKKNKNKSPPPVPSQQSKSSLQQQHAQHHMQLRHDLRHRFRLSNVLGDPFALSTISIGTIGWVIALTGSITISTTTQKFPVFTWWTVASEFLVIVGVFWITATNNLHAYRLALLAALGTTTVYTTNSTNNFVYTSSPTSAAASAGYILLSIINVLWMLYFGTTEDAALHRAIDSYAVNKPSYGPGYGGYGAYGNQTGSINSAYSAVNHTGAGLGVSGLHPNHPSNLHHQSQAGLYRDSSAYGSTPGTSMPNQKASQYFGGMENSNNQGGNTGFGQSFIAAPLGAFENSSQIHQPRGSQAHNNGLGGMSAFNDYSQYAGYRASSASTADRTSAGDIIATPTEYPYRVRANYSYVASDHNELSFEKEEILEVSDISGKWWQARKNNGEIGICPSNYVSLLNSEGEPYQFDNMGNNGTGGSGANNGLGGNVNMGDTMSSTITTTTTTTGYNHNL